MIFKMILHVLNIQNGGPHSTKVKIFNYPKLSWISTDFDYRNSCFVKLFTLKYNML